MRSSFKRPCSKLRYSYCIILSLYIIYVDHPWFSQANDLPSWWTLPFVCMILLVPWHHVALCWMVNLGTVASATLDCWEKRRSAATVGLTDLVNFPWFKQLQATPWNTISDGGGYVWKPPVLGSILNIPKQLSQNTGVIAPPPMTLSQFGGSSFGMCVHHDAALICDDLSSTKHKIHDYVPQRSLSNHVFYASSLGEKTMLTTQLKMGCLWINNA